MRISTLGKTLPPALHALPALLALLSTSCLLGPQSKRGTVVDNELRVGVIYAAEGKPAVNARVRVFPVGHLPDTSADTRGADSGGLYSTRTDGDGKYRVGTLPDGEYNILAELSGQLSYQDSVFLDGKTAAIANDTLDHPGSIAGVVGMQPNHDPRYALVQVLGTNSFANVDEQGRSTLGSLAGGRYTLRVFTGHPEYSTLLKSIVVTPGKADTLPDTLHLPFMGIPVVQGLSASFDTLNSVVTLTWNAAAYRDFQEYAVYRDASPVLNPSQAPIGLTTDNRFRDSLLDESGESILDSSARTPRTYEYRIRIKNKSAISGPSYGAVKIQTPPPQLVRSEMDLELVRVEWISPLQADSVEVRARLRNSTRKLHRLTWAVGSPDDSVKTDSLGGVPAAERILRFAWAKPGGYTLYVQVEDETGAVRLDSLPIAGNTAPSLTGLPGTSAKAYIEYRFAPNAADLDGDTLRFSAANAPPWARLDSITGVLSGTPTDADTGTYPDIVLSATDGRRTGKTEPFTLKVAANPWKPRPAVPIPFASGHAASVGGKIYLFEDSVRVFDPADGSWKAEAPMPSPGFCDFATALDGKILIFSKHSPDGVAIVNTTSSYDPSTRTWTARAPFASPASDSGRSSVMGGAVVNGVFYAIGNGRVAAYSPAADRWTEKKPMPAGLGGGIVSSFSIGFHHGRAVAVNGKILITGQYNPGGSTFWHHSAGVTGIYDPATDSWSEAPSIEPRIFAGIGAIGGKVYYAGGEAVAGYSDRMEEFDPVAGTWKTRSPMPRALRGMAYATAGGKMYFFHGSTGENSTDITTETWEYDPSLEPVE